MILVHIYQLKSHSTNQWTVDISASQNWRHCGLNSIVASAYQRQKTKCQTGPWAYHTRVSSGTVSVSLSDVSVFDKLTRVIGYLNADFFLLRLPSQAPLNRRRMSFRDYYSRRFNEYRLRYIILVGVSWASSLFTLISLFCCSTSLRGWPSRFLFHYQPS